MRAPSIRTDRARGVGLLAELAGRRFLAGSVGAYFLGFAVFGMIARRSNTVLYLVVTATLVGVFTFIHLKVGLSDGELRALALLGFFHLAGGLLQTGSDRILYNMPVGPYPLQIDRLVHAFGGGTLALVAWRMLRARAPDVDALFLVALAAMGATGLLAPRRWR